MAKTVDQLLIEIKAETSQLQKDLKQVKSKLLSTEIASEVIPEQDAVTFAVNVAISLLLFN